MGEKEFSYKYYLKKYKWDIVKLTFLYMVTIVANISTPYLSGKMIELLESGSATIPKLGMYFIVIISAFLIWDILESFIAIRFDILDRKIENDMRESLISKILHADYEKISGKSEGEIMNKIIKDTKAVEKSLSSLFNMVMSIVHTLLVVGLMFYMNSFITVILVGMYAMIIIILRITGKKLEDLYSEFKGIEDRLYKRFSIQLKGIFTTKALSIEENRIDDLKRRNGDSLKKFKQLSIHKNIILYLQFFVLSTFRVVVLFVGGIVYIQGGISLGVIFAMHSYSIQVSAFMRRFVEMDIVMKDIRTSMNRLKSLAAEFHSDESEELVELDSIESVEFKDVNFSYGEELILKDINFCGKKGDVIGIRGDNGTGKSTLSYLISGFLKTEGVFFNGVQGNRINRASVIKRETMVLQNIFLYPHSVKENLISFENTRMDKVREVIETLELEEFFQRFGEEWEKEVNDKNLNLSGGEKQLISLVRALAKPHDVLILDEFNSALDVNVKEKLVSNIHKLFKDKIVFIIAHDSEILEKCNKVISLGKKTVCS